MGTEIIYRVISVKYWNGKTRKSQVTKVVSIINGLQNYYYLILKPQDEDVVNDTHINWNSFCENYSAQNDENNHAYLYGIKLALEKLMVKCIHADNQISSGQLLKKIEKSIEKSRFVIIKVDSNNLNVYFELGLAMGLNKDVLLISEKDLVLHLPSDLKNWECLTYSEGNYDELKNKVIKFFRITITTQFEKRFGLKHIFYLCREFE